MTTIERHDEAKRLPHGQAKPRILDAAEVLFANAGLDGVSFRDLAKAAGVSLSAIHYHFGSKRAVLADVFARRARRLVERRLALLRGLHRNRQGQYRLQDVLDAFLRPAFEVTQGDRNDLFNRLLARLAVESGEVMRKIISEAFDENDLLFIDEIAKTVPHLKREDVHWRFHFFVGAMIYTMSDAGQLMGLSGGRCDAHDTEMALKNMVSAFTALFEATSTYADDGSPLDSGGR